MKMKNTGMVRKVDELGRIVIPMEIRNKFDIKEREELEIYVKENAIILRKYEPNCIFCRGNKDLVEYADRLICKECSENIKKLNNAKK